MKLLEAIAHMEGFYLDGSRPQRNHNPGDLVYATESIRLGATSSDGRFAIFPDVATGWKALQRWLSVPARFDPSGHLVGGYLGARIEQAINRFAPPNENNTQNYVAFVCKNAGITPETVLTEELLGLLG